MESVFNLMPPSVNHLYKTSGSGRRTRRTMSKEGVAAKNKLQIQVGRALGIRTDDNLWVDSTSELKITGVFYFEKLYPSSKSTKNPHLRVDVENYTKLIYDVISFVSGRDDSSFFQVHLRKVETKGKQGVYVRVEEGKPCLDDVPPDVIQLINQGVSSVSVQTSMPGSDSHREPEAAS